MVVNKYIKNVSLFVVMCLFQTKLIAQDGVSIGISRPDPSSVLHIESPTGNKGLLIPTTDDLGSIAGAADGLIVFSSVTKKFHYRDSVAAEWLTLVTAAPNGRITNVADGEAINDAVNKGQLDTKVDIERNSTPAYDKIKIRIVEIGDWNMDADAQIILPHDILGDHKIKSITAAIRFDGDIGELEDLTGAGRVRWFDGEHPAIDPGIILMRDEGGIFDDTLYDNVPYNRGWLTIIYEDN